MSLFMKSQDPNRGPITLKHDLTPRDLSLYNPSFDKITLKPGQNFRFQGYPDGAFIHPHNPAFRTEDQLLSERIRLFGLPVTDLRSTNYRNHRDNRSSLLQKESKVDVEKPVITYLSEPQAELSAIKTNDLSRAKSCEETPAKRVTLNADSNKTISYTAPESIIRSTNPVITPRVFAPSPVSDPIIRDPLGEKTNDEVLKLRHQMMDAEQDIARYKFEKLEKLKQQTTERQKDMNMLQNYYPYGKPGAGAPLQNDNKKQKFLEEDVSPREQVKYKSMSHIEEFSDAFGKPGAGAPQRTASGRIKTEISGAPDIRFQDKEVMRQSIENHLRYNRPAEEREQYSKQLDDQINEQKIAAQEVRINELKKDIELLKTNPYGKPGGGAPNRTESGRLFLTKVLKQPEDLHNNKPPKSPAESLKNSNKDNFTPFEPWGKGACQPVRNTDGGIMRHKNYISKKELKGVESDPTKGVTLDMQATSGGGAPHFTDSGNLRSKLPRTIQKDEYGHSRVREEILTNRPLPGGDAGVVNGIYFPFGSPGSGAPIVDKDGHVRTAVYGKMEKDLSSADLRRRKRAAQTYFNELAKLKVDQGKNKENDKEFVRQSGGEMVSVIREGNVGRPRRDPVTGMMLKQPLHSSDVTQLKMSNNHYMANNKSRQYHDELTRAADERHRKRELERLKDTQEAKQHECVFSDMWGRPGAGAPNQAHTRKIDLDYALHRPKKGNNPYQYFMDMHSPRGINGEQYIRSTVRSTHQNMFDFEPKFLGKPRPAYNLEAPWADNAKA